MRVIHEQLRRLGSACRTSPERSTPRAPREGDARLCAGLFPFRSHLLRESRLVSFPPLINMLKLGGSSPSTRGRREQGMESLAPFVVYKLGSFRSRSIWLFLFLSFFPSSPCLPTKRARDSTLAFSGAERSRARSLALSGCALAPPSTAEPPALPPNRTFPWGYGQGGQAASTRDWPAGLVGFGGAPLRPYGTLIPHWGPMAGRQAWPARGARGRTGHPRQQRRKREQTLHVFRERPDAGPASLQVRRTPQGGIVGARGSSSSSHTCRHSRRPRTSGTVEDKGLAVGAFAEPARPGAAARPPQPTTRHQPASQTRSPPFQEGTNREAGRERGREKGERPERRGGGGGEPNTALFRLTLKRFS